MRRIEEKMERCMLCPRSCQVDRLRGEKGRCGQDARLRIARAARHFWEEPCLSGREGSGAVFFSGCSLGCLFCQNQEISSGGRGRVITKERLAEIFLQLQEEGAVNINLVTPTHYVPQIIWALERAKGRGLTLPIVYNTSGYEKKETLRSLEGLVDIYLPDFKYVSPRLSALYSGAADYFDQACLALEEMFRQTGEAVFADPQGRLLSPSEMEELDEDEEKDCLFLMKKGLIVRHLLLPGCLEDGKAVVKYLWETYGNQIYVSLMNQYTPVRKLEGFPQLSRRVTSKEYGQLVDYALELGLERGFVQEGDTALESFIPPFDGEGT